MRSLGQLVINALSLASLVVFIFFTNLLNKDSSAAVPSVGNLGGLAVPNVTSADTPYSQSTYYGQSGYYGQSSYYSESGYGFAEGGGGGGSCEASVQGGGLECC